MAARGFLDRALLHRWLRSCRVAGVQGAGRCPPGLFSYGRAARREVLAIGGSPRRCFAATAEEDSTNPYEVLGVPRDATLEQIKAAYRKQAMKWHPDRHAQGNRKEAEQKFAAVAKAYEILSDPTSKLNYDSGRGDPEIFHKFHSHESAEALFRQVFGSEAFGDLFDQLFGSDYGLTLKAGDAVVVRQQLENVLPACRRSGLDTTNDPLRSRSLGRPGKVVKVDAADNTVKVSVQGVGDVWFGVEAVQMFGPSSRGARAGSIHNITKSSRRSSPGQGFGSSTQMRQEVVTKPDGRRVMRVTIIKQWPEGLAEETYDTPLD